MSILKSFLMAVSIYSKIPVPQLSWKKEDMRYVFCFFPWVGAVIGICVWLWNRLCVSCGIGLVCRLAVDLAIPIIITGGFHADGFLDVMDASHSYQPTKRKLEILSDAHIGAFAVLMLALYGLVYLGAFSEISDGRLLQAVCAGFFLSRCLCGISVLTFPLARQEGMLFTAVESCAKKAVFFGLCIQGTACVGFMAYVAGLFGLVVALSAVASLGYYFYRSRREFGGITGDTCGYFILLCEVCMAVAAASVNLALRVM